jgi:hypothetical protein
MSQPRLPTVARPERTVAELLQRLDLQLPEQNRIVSNAVENVVLNIGLVFVNSCKSEQRFFELRKTG